MEWVLWHLFLSCNLFSCVFTADPQMMKNLAVGIAIPVQEAIFASRKNPSPGWPESVYQLIGKTWCFYHLLVVSSHSDTFMSHIWQNVEHITRWKKNKESLRSDFTKNQSCSPRKKKEKVIKYLQLLHTRPNIINDNNVCATSSVGK